MGTKATEKRYNPQGLPSLGTLASMSSGELRQGQLAGKQLSKGHNFAKPSRSPCSLSQGSLESTELAPPYMSKTKLENRLRVKHHSLSLLQASKVKQSVLNHHTRNQTPLCPSLKICDQRHKVINQVIPEVFNPTPLPWEKTPQHTANRSAQI